MAMMKSTFERIEEVREMGWGKDWTMLYLAPVSWSTMKKYPDIFELLKNVESCVDDGDEDCIEEWESVTYKWRFK